MSEPAPPTSHSLLRHPVFPSFWLARITSSLGYQMLSVAVGWQVWDLTRRSFDLGMIGLVQFIPSVVLALPAGHLADQFDRRRIVFTGQVVEIFAIAALALLTWSGHAHEAGILALVFLISVAKGFEFPAMQSLLPSLVDVAILPRAMAASAAAFQTAMIVGPAVGGVLYVAGPAVVYGTAAALYVVAAVLMARLKYVHAPRPRAPITLRSLFAGVHFILQRRDILGVLSLDLFAVLLGGATALLPIFASEILHTGPWGLGLLRAAPAIGALLTSLALARRALQHGVGMKMFASVAGFGVATLVFALSDRLWLSLVALAALGAFDMVSVVIRSALVQLTSLVALAALGAFDMVSVVIRSALVQLDTPDSMRGRVSAVNAIFINTSNQLGEFESGIVAAWLGAVRATVVGGVGTLVVVGLWMWWFPTLRRRQRLQNEAAPTVDPPAPPAN